MAALGSLCACDNANLSETFERIKTADVDAGGDRPAADRKKLHREDIELAVTTAKDLVIGVEQETRDAAQQRLQIAVVDPLDMPSAASAETPVTETPAVSAAEPAAVPKPETPAGRAIQVGSFGSMAAAKEAWLTLQARYPGVERYSPTYQSITTAAGQSMVRLKVGPVTSQAQAAALCGQLGVRDAWCAKAS
ncbi:hypothetical protein ABAC402_03700 [Asticcacaulis sp. AC402]|nr:hypothetical protein ABAC402_03700 [Asticcacaulis sp. AC402]